MEDILFCKDAYEPVIDMKLANIIDVVWAISNRKTIALIRQWIDGSVFHHISTKINVKDL
jgi:hypothetical protein